MSTSDRLDQIEADIPLAARSPEMAQHFTADHGLQLVAALCAVLDVCERSELGWYPEPKYDEYIPGQLDTAERVRAAITAALGEDTP